MNKVDLVEEVASQTGLTKKTSKEAVDAITSVIGDTLARGEKVSLVGFGSFQVVERKARRGRNPQTGQTIQIPAKKVPRRTALEGFVKGTDPIVRGGEQGFRRGRCIKLLNTE